MKDLQKKSGVARRSKIGLIETEKTLLTEQCKNWPTSSGKTQYLRYLQGVKLTHMEAVLAKCAECCCGYVDGRYDCEIPACPLYQFMPYTGQHEHISAGKGGEA